MWKHSSDHTGPLVMTLAVMLIFFSVVGYLNFSIIGEQQFSFLAHSFLKGKTYFLNTPGTWNDTVPYGGNHYWPLSPFPALALMPFVFLFEQFDAFFYIGYLQFFLVLGTFLSIYKICRRIKYTPSDSLVLALAFCCASSYLGVAACSWSWPFAQVVTVCLTFLLLLEYSNKRRYWLIGLFASMILATRVTAAGVLLFILIDLFLITPKDTSYKIKRCCIMFLPIFLTVIGLALYNYSRFDSFWEQGYSLQNLSKALTKSRSYGMVDLVHLPGNLYYFLLSAPLPVLKDQISPVLSFPYVRANPWGMGLFFVSPYFIYLFLVSHRNQLSKALWCSICIIAIPILLYYGVGYKQFGYRYSLDFLPLLFFVLILNYRQLFETLSLTFKLLVALSALINVYLFLTLFFLRTMVSYFT